MDRASIHKRAVLRGQFSSSVDRGVSDVEIDMRDKDVDIGLAFALDEDDEEITEEFGTSLSCATPSPSQLPRACFTASSSLPHFSRLGASQSDNRNAGSSNDAFNAGSTLPSRQCPSYGDSLDLKGQNGSPIPSEALTVFAPETHVPTANHATYLCGAPPGMHVGAPHWASAGYTLWGQGEQIGRPNGCAQAAPSWELSAGAITNYGLDTNRHSMTFENPHEIFMTQPNMQMTSVHDTNPTRRGLRFGPTQGLRYKDRAKEASVTEVDKSEQKAKNTDAYTSEEHLQENKERFRAQFFKTRLCRFYLEGCRRGEECPFAHGLHELAEKVDLAKTSLCREWERGCCLFADDECEYAHGHDDLRVTRVFNKSAMCTLYPRGLCTLGDRCRHAHSVDELRKPTQRLR